MWSSHIGRNYKLLTDIYDSYWYDASLSGVFVLTNESKVLFIKGEVSNGKSL
jgi:hypothetical protein